MQISALDGGDLLTMHDIWPLGFAFMFWIWITMAHGCLTADVFHVLPIRLFEEIPLRQPNNP